MKRLALVVALTALALTGMSAAPAAASTYDPNVSRVANPANVCKSIPGSVANASSVLGFPIDISSFDYVSCVQTLAQGAAVVEPAELYGSPYEQCDALMQFGFSYPSTLHNGDDLEDQLLPDLIVKNRKQCGSALYAYHTIFTYVFGG